MGNIPCVTGASGYADQPDVVLRRVKAGEAITAGAVLMFSNSAADGVTVLESAGNNWPCGVAAEAAASGDWFDMQTFGLNVAAMTCTATDITSGQMIYCDTDDGVVSGCDLDGPGTANADGRFVGVALEAETGTTLAKGTIMICCNGGW